MSRRENLIIWINSTTLFLVAYVLVYSIIGLATIISASAFDISAELFYNQIYFHIRSRDWTSDAVKVVFSTGPILALLAGLVLWILYTKVEEEAGILKVLVLWMVMHCIIYFFGDMMMGALFSRGLGYVIMYLYFMDTGKMIITLFALMALFTIGLIMARQTLYTANAYVNTLHARQTKRFVLFQFLLPFLIGNIIIILVKFPGITLFEIFLNGSMVVLMIPIYIRAGMMQDLFFEEETKAATISWISILTAMILLILFRVVFGFGVRF